MALLSNQKGHLLYRILHVGRKNMRLYRLQRFDNEW